MAEGNQRKEAENNSDEFRKSEALRLKEIRNQKLEENSEEFRKSKALRLKEIRDKKLEENLDEFKTRQGRPRW